MVCGMLSVCVCMYTVREVVAALPWKESQHKSKLSSCACSIHFHWACARENYPLDSVAHGAGGGGGGFLYLFFHHTSLGKHSVGGQRHSSSLLRLFWNKARNLIPIRTRQEFILSSLSGLLWVLRDTWPGSFRPKALSPRSLLLPPAPLQYSTTTPTIYIPFPILHPLAERPPSPSKTPPLIYKGESSFSLLNQLLD